MNGLKKHSSSFKEAVKKLAENKTGKVLPDAVYLHYNLWRSVEQSFPEEFARDLNFFIYMQGGRDYSGSVVIKFSRKKFVVSILYYEGFLTNPHPYLLSSKLRDYSNNTYKVMSYRTRKNKPVLHRTEQMMLNSDLKDERQRLTKLEESLGLYENTRTIGTQNGWNKALETKGVSMRDIL